MLITIIQSTLSALFLWTSLRAFLCLRKHCHACRLKDYCLTRDCYIIGLIAVSMCLHGILYAARAYNLLQDEALLAGFALSNICQVLIYHRLLDIYAEDRRDGLPRQHNRGRH